MKKMVLTTGLPVHCFSSVSDWAFDESRRKGKKRGEGEREEILFLSCPFPSPSSHFFALFPTVTTNKRGSACYVGYWYTTRPPFHCFGRPAIQPQRLTWKRLLAHFIQAFLCSVFFVFFNLHWITGQLQASQAGRNYRTWCSEAWATGKLGRRIYLPFTGSA